MPHDVVCYPRYRFPPAIISHAVWLNYRFTLSFRDVEDLPAHRGITVSYESIRHCCETFGLAYARRLRHRAGPIGNTWHLDELFVTIHGQRQYLWLAVDQDGDVIDILLPVPPRPPRRRAVLSQIAQAERPCPAPPGHGRLGSYRAAQRIIMPSVVHDTTRYANNRVEVSHQPTRGREPTCGASNRRHMPNGSTRSTTSCATCLLSDDIGFAPAISDVCARARSVRGRS